jgi:hypothetical protein
MVDLDTAFGQQLFDVAVRQAVAQIPANATLITSGRDRTRQNPSAGQLPG